MVTNPVFNTRNAPEEQELIQGLISEAISIYGEDMYYVPRTLNNYDGFYGEDSISTYEDAYLFEMYLKSYEAFGGQGSFLSKFGLEIRDQAVFTISTRTFENEVTKRENTILRPRESDLIFMPVHGKCFKIKKAEKFSQLYPLGSLYVYDVETELFEYSNERFSTGIEAIDAIQIDHALVEVSNASSNIAEITNDPLADNYRIEVESDRNNANTSVIKWDEVNPFVNSTDGKF